MDDALARAKAYIEAGADAILIHSKIATAEQVLNFKSEWQDRCPVVIVPTMYHSTPTSVFRENGFSVAIWANHLVRATITSLQQAAAKIHAEESISGIDKQIVPVKEIFRLQNAAELQAAEKKYLPATTEPAVDATN